MALAAYSQDDNTMSQTDPTPTLFSVPVGIGTTSSSTRGTLHLHDTRINQPVLPPSPDGSDGNSRDGIYDGYFETVLHMTNPTTGYTATDGFSITQTENNVTMRQFESGTIKILGTLGSGITVNNGGYVGIGMEPSASYRLKVAGDMYIGVDLKVTNELKAGSASIGNGFTCSADGQVRTKGIRVTLDGWSDFVFDDGYRLPSLKEVEQYIARHRHLPDIPSAAEVEQQGIDLGQMNALLLQKVEELTLYIIDMQKQINELKQQN